jgi:hypothetical protein
MWVLLRFLVSMDSKIINAGISIEGGYDYAFGGVDNVL